MINHTFALALVIATALMTSIALAVYVMSWVIVLIDSPTFNSILIVSMIGAMFWYIVKHELFRI